MHISYKMSYKQKSGERKGVGQYMGSYPHVPTWNILYEHWLHEHDEVTLGKIWKEGFK